MEVKINKEIRNYTEKIFFGLSLRQFVFSVCACIVAIVLYFICNKHFNKEITSWICIIGVLPFIGLGFFKYNGMTLEKFLYTFLKSEVLIPKNLKFKSNNIYYDLFKENIDKRSKEDLNAKNNNKHKKTRKR